MAHMQASDFPSLCTWRHLGHYGGVSFISCRCYIVNSPPCSSPLHLPSLPVRISRIPRFAEIAGDVYHGEYQDFLSNIAPINLGLGYIMSCSCIVKTDFHDRLLLAIIRPLFVFIIVLVSFAIVRKRKANSQQAVRAIEKKHVSAAIFVAIFAYSSVSFRKTINFHLRRPG